MVDFREDEDFLGAILHKGTVEVIFCFLCMSDICVMILLRLWPRIIFIHDAYLLKNVIFSVALAILRFQGLFIFATSAYALKPIYLIRYQLE